VTYKRPSDSSSFYHGNKQFEHFSSICEQYNISNLLTNRQPVTPPQNYPPMCHISTSTIFKTKDGRLINLKGLSRKDVYEILCHANPVLANRMKDYLLNNNKKSGREADDIFCFQANYMFGDKIIDNKEVFISLADGGSISVNDPNMPDSLLELLSYTPGINNPVGMVLDHESEFYLPVKDRIVSYGTIKKGQIFGYSSIMDAVMKLNSDKSKKVFVSNWNLNAGARLAFVLPQISENQKHAKMLKTYGIEVEKPNNYIEQCNVFKALNAVSKSPWKQSVLYFAKPFLNELANNPNCMAIHQELAAIHRSGYNIWHSAYPKFESDINKILSELDLNIYSSYAINIVKHLYLIVAEGTPGFVPTTYESMLPKKLIENAYVKGYGLTENWPIPMQPQLFNTENNSAVYYGINLPTLINYNPETFCGKTIIALLYEVQAVLSRCQDYIQNKFEDRDSVLYETAKKVKFTFYHSGSESAKDKKTIIKNSALLPKEDPRFYKKGWAFPHLCQFVRGCIKIEYI